MLHFSIALLLALLATQAQADVCPDRYRFVDFGTTDREGILRRGGTVIRAFDTQNTHLLKRESVTCLEVEENAVDGRALKIPVVSTIEIDTSIAKLDLLSLRIGVIDDAVAAAEQNAAPHQAALAQASITKSNSYVCALFADTTTTSCQHVSPYLANAPLVSYCNGQTCEMPALALNDGIYITTSWAQSAQSPDALGQEISAKLSLVQAFLKPHISAPR